MTPTTADRRATACRTIQAAVNKASAGDTVNVGAGTFSESELVHSISLVGVGMFDTIVDAGGIAKPLNIDAKWRAIYPNMAFANSGDGYTDGVANAGVVIRNGSDVSLTHTSQFQRDWRYQLGGGYDQ